MIFTHPKLLKYAYASKTTIFCLDIDECTEKIDDCDQNARCTNNAGGYNCTCILGYKGDGKSCVGKFGICDSPKGEDHKLYV